MSVIATQALSRGKRLVLRPCFAQTGDRLAMTTFGRDHLDALWASA
jgi:hypothetical protein